MFLHHFRQIRVRDSTPGTCTTSVGSISFILKLFLHVTSACAFASNVKNRFYSNKWLCLHLTFVCACDAENGSGTHSLHVCLHHHWLNVKVDVHVDIDANADAPAIVTCKQSIKASPVWKILDLPLTMINRVKRIHPYKSNLRSSLGASSFSLSMVYHSLCTLVVMSVMCAFLLYGDTLSC